MQMFAYMCRWQWNCLLDEIGRGSFGMVHRGIWKGTLVAAKVVPCHVGDSCLNSREISIFK